MKNTIRIGVFLLALIISCQPDKDFLNAVSKKLPDPPKNLTFSSVGSNDVDLSWAAPDDSTDPQNLNAENITSSTVDLNWSASADNVGVTGYKIYQDGTEIDI